MPRTAAFLNVLNAFRLIRDFVAAHREAGVTLPAIRPIGFPDALHSLPTVEAAIAA